VIGFVLSGGANLGSLHVGMLKALVEAGIKPDVVVGTSIGAVNAAHLAFDPSMEQLERLQDCWCGVRARDIFPLSPVQNARALFRRGGFFSSQDADSEGIEGKFFTWSWAELTGLVGEPVARAFGATPDGNWTGEEGRTNVLWRPRSITEVAAETGRNAADVRAEVEDARAVLFASREARVHPVTDDKVLAARNGMALAAPPGSCVSISTRRRMAFTRATSSRMLKGFVR
jgi:predicted acylesterase/phospholipase RssA